MKNISCVLLCVLLINSLKLVIGDANTTELIMKCKFETGASDADVKAIAEKKMPTSHSGFCLLSCLYEHLGIIKDGKFVVENLNKIIGASTANAQGGIESQRFVEEVTNDCKDVHNNDKCILSKDIIMCAAESVSRHMKQKNEL